MTTRPRVAVLFRTHIWPLSDRARFAHVHLAPSLSAYACHIARYNSDPSRKFDMDLWLSYDPGLKCDFDFYTWDIMPLHVYDIDSVNSHGFVHSRHKDLSSNITYALDNCPKEEPKRGQSWDECQLGTFSPQPMWFNPEYGLLDFYMAKDSSYAYYWMFEYDVWFKGNFQTYLSAYDSVDKDFMCYLGPEFKKFNTWGHWDYVPEIGMKSFAPDKNKGAPSRGYWGGVGRVDSDLVYGGYFPVTRFSNSAVKSLYSAYTQDKVCGFCEVLVPTYLLSKGFSIDNLDHYSSAYEDSCVMIHKSAEYLGKSFTHSAYGFGDRT